jgi:uncharacterized membrane protein
MTPTAKLAACQRVLETTKAHNQKLREENEKLRDELRDYAAKYEAALAAMGSVKVDLAILNSRLHEAGLFSARAKYEAVLVRRDGWAKVVNCPSRRDLNPFHPVPAQFVDSRLGAVFYLTDEHDPFGRRVYRER